MFYVIKLNVRQYDSLSFLAEELSEMLVYQTEMSDKNFLCKLAFLTDITMHLNVLNLTLWKRNQNISHLAGHAETLKKLRLFATILFTKKAIIVKICIIFEKFKICICKNTK